MYVVNPCFFLVSTNGKRPPVYSICVLTQFLAAKQTFAFHTQPNTFCYGINKTQQIWPKKGRQNPLKRKFNWNMKAGNVS